MAEQTTDYPVDRDALLYETREDGSSKGWRADLLVENLSSKVEEKLLLCNSCNGLLRDACLYGEELYREDLYNLSRTIVLLRYTFQGTTAIKCV